MSFLKRLFGTSERKKEVLIDDNRRAVENINLLTNAYGAVLQKHAKYGIALFDVSTLPDTKENVAVALMGAIVLCSDAAALSVLKASLLSLADYQEGVGDEPATLLPDLSFGKDSPTTDDIGDHARRFSEHSATGRYRSFKPLIDRDIEHFSNLYNTALKMRETSGL
jgi:hypothetical protein